MGKGNGKGNGKSRGPSFRATRKLIGKRARNNLLCRCGRPVRGNRSSCCQACPRKHTAMCQGQQCDKQQSDESFEVSLVRGWDDIIKKGISDHLPMMFTVNGSVSWACPRIISWNILKQCRVTKDRPNNGFNISETPNAYLRRLRKVAGLVALALGLGEIVVLQECPAKDTPHFDTWIKAVVKCCHSKPRFVVMPVDSTMSLVTLWNEASWRYVQHHTPSMFESRAIACEFEDEDKTRMCILNVHLAWGGQPLSDELKKHTTDMAKKLSKFLQATCAHVAMAVGDYNLDVDSLQKQMRPRSKFQSACLINSSQSWNVRSPKATTVDGALVHFGQ